MSNFTRMPELRRDRIAVVTNIAAVAIVGILSSALWMLVR